MLRFILITICSLIMTAPIWAFADQQVQIAPELGSCRLQQAIANQQHFTCTTAQTGKDFHLLLLNGTFNETAYYHGLFLRSQIEDGLLKGINTELGRSLAALSNQDRDQFQIISQCVLDRMFDSSSENFKQSLRQLQRGMKDAGSRVSLEEIYKANLMVELSIYFETLEQELEITPRQTKMQLIKMCPRLIGHSIGNVFQKMAKTLRRLKMGCTGIAAPAANTIDQSLVLGRNFDTGLLGFFERYPTIVKINQPSGMTTLGIASAGLHYAGGISGMNSSGLVASLHQLETYDTRIEHATGSAESAPFLVQQILNSAKNLDEAISIAKKTKGFGAWTIFIGDSKTDELASIELSGKQTVVARRVRSESLAQTNHYLDPLMAKTGFEFSLNKSYESRARLSYVQKELTKDEGRIDAQWVIDHLSAHTDDLVGRRSFGKTTTKVYTASTHVMIPQRQEWWMTLGEQYPTNQGAFYGMKLTENGIDIFSKTWAHREYDLPYWYESQAHYVQAFKLNEDNFKNIEITQKVLSELDLAIALARKDHVEELPYLYIRGRTLLNLGLLYYRKNQVVNAMTAYQQAAKAFEEILQLNSTGSIPMISYEIGLTKLWLARTQKQIPQQKKIWLQTAKESKTIFRELERSNPNHFGFLKVYWSADQDLDSSELLDIPISFPTVE